MTRLRIKIVPDAEPNAEGRWIVVDVPDFVSLSSWLATELQLARYAPEGHHVVVCERVLSEDPTS